MATKDLGRTPLEAGNQTEYHNVRRRVRRRARHEAKVFCDIAQRDADAIDAIPAPMAPEHWRGLWPSDMHDDAIGPVKRWIRSQVGRRWDDVYSEIRSRFDMRTLAGRHIVEQHLLGYVDFRGDDMHEHRDLLVDEEGILRERPPQKWWRKKFPRERQSVSDRAFDRWLAGRKVGQRGSVLFWFVPTGLWRREKRERYQPRADHWGWETVIVPADITTYRQASALSSDEVAFYERLTSDQRTAAAMDLAIDRTVRHDRRSPLRWRIMQAADLAPKSRAA